MKRHQWYSVDPCREIHDLHVVDKTTKTSHKSQVRLIVLHVKVSVLLALELDHEYMCEPVLDQIQSSKQRLVRSKARYAIKHWKNGILKRFQHTCKPSGLLSLPPLADLIYSSLLVG